MAQYRCAKCGKTFTSRKEPKEYTLSTDEKAKAKKHLRRVQLRCPHCGETNIYERTDG